MALKEAVLSAGPKAQYDEHAKEILANAQILGRIMQECVDEFKGKPLSEVISAVNRSELKNSRKVSVEAGLTNRVIGDMQEDAVNNEGIIYFDLLFSAAITGTKAIAVRINIEAQRKYNPGYDLIQRGIFYCARLISSQGNTIFSVKRQEYDKLQKVYSIWICMDSPNEVSDGITAYQMQPEAIYGTQDLNARYDLLEVVSIRLGKHSEESQNTLIKVLSAAFSEHLSAEQKIEKLRNYGVQVDETLRKEINEMCDLSDGVYNSGYDTGYGKGYGKGVSNKTIQVAKNLLNAMPDWPDQKIADIVKDISAEEVEKLRKGENL